MAELEKDLQLSLSYLKKAEDFILNNEDHLKMLATVFFTMGESYNNHKNKVEAEKWYLKSIDTAQMYKSTYLLSYQVELLNFYYRNNNLIAAVDIGNAWLSDEQFKVQEWTRMYINLYYIMSWIQSAKHPEKAIEYLGMITPKNAVDKIELLLAKAVINKKIGLSENFDHDQVKKLIASVELDYEWSDLAFYTYSIEPSDESDENHIRSMWYGEIKQFLSGEDFKYLQQKIMNH